MTTMMTRMRVELSSFFFFLSSPVAAPVSPSKISSPSSASLSSSSVSSLQPRNKGV